MARGFDESRPDIGALESRVTTEDRSVFNDRGDVVYGMASRQFFDLLLDDEFWDTDPETTNVGSIVQAIQSVILADSEVQANDIRRQRYLQRASTLSRFAGILELRSGNLTKEELRSRLLDCWMSYHDHGTVSSLQRVVGAFTNLPGFYTRVDKFPGYWVMGRSYITPSHVVSPRLPIEGIDIRALSPDVIPGGGEIRLVTATGLNSFVQNQNFLYLSWRAPNDTDFGPLHLITNSGRYEITSQDEDLIAYLDVDVDILPDVPEGVVGLTVSFGVAYYPDTCQDGQNWIPGREALKHGIVVETLGNGRLRPEDRAEFERVLRDVADCAPLYERAYDLEEPGLTYAAAEIAAAWVSNTPPSFVTAVPASANVFGLRYPLPTICDELFDDTRVILTGTGTAVCPLPLSATGSAFYASASASTGVPVVPAGSYCIPWSASSLFPVTAYIQATQPDGTSVLYPASASAVSTTLDLSAACSAVAVPLCGGPFIVIKERYREYELADAENAAFGPTFYWRVDDEILTQPRELSGISLTEISADTVTGVGQLCWHADSGTLQWQAPDRTGPEGLDPQGSGATLTTFELESEEGSSLSGVTIRGVSATTRPGDGRLSFLASPPRLVWVAPGDVTGPETPLDELGLTVLTSEAGSRMYIDVDPEQLPGIDREIGVTVTAFSVGDENRDFILTSGNPLYRLGVRAMVRQLPDESVTTRIQVRSIGIETQPVLTTSMSASSVDVSVLDRKLSENVVRRIYQRQGDTEDQNDGTWTEYSQLSAIDSIELTKPYIRFRIEVEDHPDHIGFLKRSDYEFVSLAMRPRVSSPDTECWMLDDFYRYTTTGLDADCDLYTDFGVVSGGLDGFLTPVFSPDSAPEGFL